MSIADVDAYLSELPGEDREALELVRKIIRSAAPDAEEAISYGIPLYKLNGHLIGFAAFKKHLSLFVIDSGILDRFSEDLEPFDCKGTTVHFTAEQPLPEDLIRRIVEARIAENEAR